MRYLMSVLLPLIISSVDSNGWQASLSILPDLAFFFEGDNSTLYDVTGTNFTKLGVISASVYFNGIPPMISASAYLLANDKSSIITAFMKETSLYFIEGDVTEKQDVGLPELYDGAPRRVDAAFSVVVNNRTVIGTNFIRSGFIYQCEEIGSVCIKQKLREYAPLSQRFLRDGRKVLGALGLPNGRAMLLKETFHVILKDGEVEAERRNDEVFDGCC